MDIIAYAYNAALYCGDCIINAFIGGQVARFYAEEALDDLALGRGIDRHDEHTFDTSEFPKVAFSGQVDDGETCYRCGCDLD